MIVRGVDVNNDFLFGKGLNDYKSFNDAIGQNIKTELQSFLGDCFFALADGVDWFNLLGSKNTALLQLAVSTSILNVDGVLSFTQPVVLNLDENRVATISYSVSTIYTGNNPNLVLSATNVFILTESGDNLTTEDGGALMGG